MPVVGAVLTHTSMLLVNTTKGHFVCLKCVLSVLFIIMYVVIINIGIKGINIKFLSSCCVFSRTYQNTPKRTRENKQKKNSNNKKKTKNKANQNKKKQPLWKNCIRPPFFSAHDYGDNNKFMWSYYILLKWPPSVL